MKRSLAWFGIGLLVASSLFGVVWAATSGDAEVRINARRLDDGRVEVGLQQRGDSGWANRQLPDSRFIPPNAEAGRWLNSNPINVTVSDSAVVGNVPEAQGIGFLCMVTHEQPGQEAFWNEIRQGAARVHAIIGVPVRVKAGPEVEQQAELIRECVAEGAAGIATTLPDPAGLAAALAKAKAAGVSIVSFNSGLNHYASVGSAQHHSIEETTAGRQAGARLNEHGVSGTVLCVVHETANVGLVERCDGLESGYDGEVERLSVAQSGVADLAASTATIAERLRGSDGEPEVEAIVTLNTQIGLAAVDAIAETGASVVVATFDQTNAVLEAIIRGEILFSIDTNPFRQSWITLTSLIQIIRSDERIRNLFGIDDPSLIAGPNSVLLSTDFFTKEIAEARIALNRGIAQDLGE